MGEDEQTLFLSRGAMATATLLSLRGVTSLLTRVLDTVPPLVRGPQAAAARHMVLRRLQGEAGHPEHVRATHVGVDGGDGRRPEGAEETVINSYWIRIRETGRLR